MAALPDQDWLANAVGDRVQQFYSEIGVDLPSGSGQLMVNCFANPGAHKHDDRTKSCCVNGLTGLWKCHGCGEAGNAFQAARVRGYSDRHAARLAKRHGLFLERKDALKPEWFAMGGARQWLKWTDTLQSKPAIVRRLGEVKGWTPEAILRLGLGWDGERLTFVSRRVVGANWKLVGCARYLPGGRPKMVSLAGSERTLFPPPELCVRTRPLWIVEGEPDAVSVRSAGHQAVGVPGVRSWKRQWAWRFSKFKQLLVLCDCDAQGRELAENIRRSMPRVRVIDLEPDRTDGYDIGDLVLECSHEGGVWQATRLLSEMAS